MKITKAEQLLSRINLAQTPQELSEYLVSCCVDDAIAEELNDFIMLSVFTQKEREQIETDPSLLYARRGTMNFGVSEVKNDKVQGLVFHSYESREDSQDPDWTDLDVVARCRRFLRIENQTIVGIYLTDGEEPEWD